MRIGPRRRYLLSMSAGLGLLYAAGLALHLHASARSGARACGTAAAAAERCAALESRLAALESAAPGTAPESAGGASQVADLERAPVRPRLLGSGRSGAWRYSDMRLPDGSVRRYYARTNATPRQLLSLARTMRADLSDALGQAVKGQVPPAE